MALEQPIWAPSGSRDADSSAQRIWSSRFERIRSAQWLWSSRFEQPVAPEMLIRAPSGSGAANFTGFVDRRNVFEWFWTKCSSKWFEGPCWVCSLTEVIIYEHICRSIYGFVGIHQNIYNYTRLCRNIREYVYVYIYIYSYTFSHIRIYIYIFILIYIYIYIYVLKLIYKYSYKII